MTEGRFTPPDDLLCKDIRILEVIGYLKNIPVIVLIHQVPEKTLADRGIHEETECIDLSQLHARLFIRRNNSFIPGQANMNNLGEPEQISCFPESNHNLKIVGLDLHII